MRIKGNKRENKEIGIKAKAEQKGRPKFMKRQTRKKKKNRDVGIRRKREYENGKKGMREL